MACSSDQVTASPGCLQRAARIVRVSRVATSLGQCHTAYAEPVYGRQAKLLASRYGSLGGHSTSVGQSQYKGRELCDCGSPKKVLDKDIIYDIIANMVKEITRDFILRLPPTLFKQLEREVKIQKSSRTKLVRQVLAEYLNSKELDRDFERDFKSEEPKEVALKARAATQK